MTRTRELTGRTVVVSPHLDDGVLSLGASIARAARGGALVDVLTVFAGDPESQAPAGRWDAAAGFATEGEAVSWRRGEDLRACEALGARPVWLTFGERHYERRGDDATILAAILECLDGIETLLVPGSPLVHPDHALVAELLLREPLPVPVVGLYREQPYCSARWSRRQARRGRRGPSRSAAGAKPFEQVRLGVRDRQAKWRAVGAYGSQLRLLDGRAGRALIRLGSEAVAWLPERYGEPPP